MDYCLWCKQMISRIFAKSYYLLKGHVLNSFGASREQRRMKRNLAMGDSVQLYLSRYKPFVRSLQISCLEGSSRLTEVSPLLTEGSSRLTDVGVLSDYSERAFTIWLQGEDEAPEIVKACIRSMRGNLKQEVIVLDENNIFDWITLPDYIVEKWRKGIIKPAHFTDICRVELLYQYGGLWIDATDYITSPIPEEIMKSGFFVYMAGRKVSAWFSFIQNCFIRAVKGDSLLGAWRAAIWRYWQEEDSAYNYFVHQLLFRFVVENNEAAAKLFERMPKRVQDPTHVLWFDHKDDPYDAEAYARLTSGTFFQKTTYRDPRSLNPLPGSMAAHLLDTKL